MLLQFKFSNYQSFGLLDWPDLNLLLLLTILEMNQTALKFENRISG